MSSFKSKDSPIYVTQPFLPPLDEYNELLRKVWNNKWLSNDGEFHKKFELELAEYLGVKYISLFANGTLALMTALQSLKITGEVITTPYTFVATANSIAWNGLKPVFVDIDPKTGNICPLKIESVITESTTAIMPVHVYGNSCNTIEIQRVADTFGLKVIYDACHAFGVKPDIGNIFDYGDLSILSFHATKVFNCAEGGAIISHDENHKNRIDYLKNFGFAGNYKIIASGINGKMNELQSSLGLLQLKYIDSVLDKRKSIAEIYTHSLSKVDGINPFIDYSIKGHNNSYYPVLVDEQVCGINRDVLCAKLNEYDIYPRKYFYPLVSEFGMYKNLPSAESEKLANAFELSRKVLCLPLYPDLKQEQQEYVIEKIMEAVN